MQIKHSGTFLGASRRYELLKMKMVHEIFFFFLIFWGPFSILSYSYHVGWIERRHRAAIVLVGKFSHSFVTEHKQHGLTWSIDNDRNRSRTTSRCLRGSPSWFFSCHFDHQSSRIHTQQKILSPKKWKHFYGFCTCAILPIKSCVDQVCCCFGYMCMDIYVCVWNFETKALWCAKFKMTNNFGE